MYLYYSQCMATVIVWIYITVQKWPQLVYGHILQFILQKHRLLVDHTMYSYFNFNQSAVVLIKILQN